MSVFRHSRRITLAMVALVVPTLGCNRHPAPAASPSPFQRSLHRAALAAGADEALPVLGPVLARVPLTGRAGLRIARLLPLPDRLVVDDVGAARVDAFARSGRWLNRIGRAGTSQGSYVLPTGIARLGDTELAILDFRPARISVFSVDGTFHHSQLYTHLRFSGVQLAFLPEHKTYILFRNNNGRLINAVRAADTTLLTSQLRLPDEAHHPWAYRYYEPAVATSRETIYIVFPFPDAVYRLANGVTLSQIATILPGTYRPPHTDMDEPTPGETSEHHYQRFQTWRLQFTAPDGIAVSHGQLLVSTQTFDPLRYTVEIFDVHTFRRMATFHTNHELLCSDLDGVLYFREAADASTDGSEALLEFSPRQ